MDTSKRQNGMDERQAAVEEALTKWGFQSIWANGKGGGFWVKGHGYLDLMDCVKLINSRIADFEKDEKNRLNEMLIEAEKSAKDSANSRYFSKMVAAYADIEAQIKSLETLSIPFFQLPPVRFDSLPGRFPKNDLIMQKRAEVDRLRQLQRERGDRLQSDEASDYEAQADALEAEINQLINLSANK